MPFRVCPALLLSGILLAGPVSAGDGEDAAAATEPSVPVEKAQPANASGVAFDALFARIEDNDFIIEDSAHSKRLLEELKSLLPEGDDRRARLYDAMYCALGFENRTADGLAFAEERLAAARASGDRVAIARLSLCASGYHGALGAPQEALRLLDDSIEAAREAGDGRLLGYALSARGASRSLGGELAAALVDLLDAYHIFEHADLPRDAEDLLLNISVVYRRMGLYDKASEYLERTTAVAEARNDHWTAIGVQFQRGFLAQEQGRFEESKQAFDQALKAAIRYDDRYNQAMARMALAGVQVDLKRPAQALRLLERARKDFEANENRSSDGMMALTTGQALGALGRHREALKAYAEAEQVLRAEDNLRYLVTLYRARADSHEALREFALALADLKQYIETREALDRKASSERTLFMQNQFDAAQRDLENQRLSAEKALREQEVASLVKTRRWQWAAIVMGAVLMLLLAGLAIRQVLRLRRLQVLALTDALTGVGNRRRIERFAGEQIAESLANRRAFTVLTLDVDYFKRINDTYGHQVGDEVLVQVARTCEAALREFDQIGRTGGEEFLIVLPRTQLQQAVQVAERLRGNVEKLDLESIAPGLKPSISIGIAEFKPEDKELKELVRRADNALYRAKANGRNRVEVEA